MQKYAVLFDKNEHIHMIRKSVDELLEWKPSFERNAPAWLPYSIGVLYILQDGTRTHEICDEDTLRIILSTEEEG